jgi:hypothetical protein
MGKREDCLRYIFHEAGANISENNLPRLKLQIIQDSSYYKEIENVYRVLGGLLDTIPCRLKKWDIEVNNIAVELDEERHFNRYRAITLNSNLYSKLTAFPLKEYKRYSTLYEEQCLKTASFGRYWTNDSCEKQFGVASELKELSGNGSPRWKQRAFYDYLRDLTPLIIGIHVARISIWDKLNVSNKSITVAEILDNTKLEASGELLQLIKERTCKN